MINVVLRAGISREVEVLQLIAEGEPNKQVAAELGVNFRTVDKHRQHLMAKLNIHDGVNTPRLIPVLTCTLAHLMIIVP